jgi:hypothetical protein
MSSLHKGVSFMQAATSPDRHGTYEQDLGHHTESTQVLVLACLGLANGLTLVTASAAPDAASKMLLLARVIGNTFTPSWPRILAHICTAEANSVLASKSSRPLVSLERLRAWLPPPAGWGYPGMLKRDSDV